jgi:hypothetical protein
MFIRRVLRHPAMVTCVVGHASCVVVWALFCWSAGTFESTTLNVGVVMFSLLLMLLDLPVVILVCLAGGPILKEVFFEHPGFLWFSLYVLVLGSIQWSLIGMFFAIPDLRNEPKP